MKSSFVFLSFFLLACPSAQSQIFRLYLDKENKFTGDSSKASSYVKMVLEPSDSTWKVHHYSMKDTLLMIGNFKDPQMVMPHGKFSFFDIRPAHSQPEYNNKNNQIENVVTPSKYWLEKTGEYVNGEKEGEWIKYDTDGGIESTTTWKKGKENGIYRSYGYDSQKVRFEGNYINGVREGVWLTYATSGDIMTEETYKHGRVTRNFHRYYKTASAGKVSDSKAPPNFSKNLRNELEKIDFDFVEGRIQLIFKTTIDGHLACKSFFATKRFPNQSILAVISAIKNSPAWKPATQNGATIEQIFPIYIDVPSLDIQIGLGEFGKAYMERAEGMRQ